mmetsp:Transcript_18899/g.59933  ORF Transcript_18899/g.59933 Transcript_18899/m.59933 type:complete len:205 (-) Transcript_18899:193-807(-)
MAADSADFAQRSAFKSSARGLGVVRAGGGGGGGGAGSLPSMKELVLLRGAAGCCAAAGRAVGRAASASSAARTSICGPAVTALLGAYSRCNASNSLSNEAWSEPRARDSLIARMSSAISSVASSISSTCRTSIFAWSCFSTMWPAFMASTARRVNLACSCWSARLSQLNCAPMRSWRWASNIFFLFIACNARCLATGSLAALST